MNILPNNQIELSTVHNLELRFKMEEVRSIYLSPHSIPQRFARLSLYMNNQTETYNNPKTEALQLDNLNDRIYTTYSIPIETALKLDSLIQRTRLNENSKYHVY